MSAKSHRTRRPTRSSLLLRLSAAFLCALLIALQAGAAPVEVPGSGEGRAEDPPTTVLSAAQLAQGRYTGTPVTMKVVDIPLRDFFRIVSEVSGLNVMVDSDVAGSVTLNMEAVPWDQLFQAVLRSNRLESIIEGNLVRVSTKETIRLEEETRRQIKREKFLAADTRTDTFHLNYAVATDISQTLQDQLTDRGQIDVDQRTNTLIITDIEDSFARVDELIRKLDVPEQQVEIEARIVEATTNFMRELGSNLNVRIGGRPGDRNLGVGQINAGQGSVSRELGRIVGGSVGGIGGSFGRILDVFELDVLITAAEDRGDARILSKPRVSAQNNAEAVITQGAKIPIPVTQNFTTRVRFEEAALKLTVTPQITQENTVLLKMRVENDVPDFSQTVLGIPTILISQAETLVLVPDGGTTVIGGIFTETERTEITQVPGLGNIPVLGHLFKNSSKERETREILFFITVRIK